MSGSLHGPHLWEVCCACNYVKHSCHFCGTDLRHDEVHEPDGTRHPCYDDSLPPPDAWAES